MTSQDLLLIWELFIIALFFCIFYNAYMNYIDRKTAIKYDAQEAEIRKEILRRNKERNEDILRNSIMQNQEIVKTIFADHDGKRVYFCCKGCVTAFKKNPTKFIAGILAIIFKDTELTNTEHYSMAHIEYKAELIRKEITYDIALPFIADYSVNLIEMLELYKK